jgi:hypothetical protein
MLLVFEAVFGVCLDTANKYRNVKNICFTFEVQFGINTIFLNLVIHCCL